MAIDYRLTVQQYGDKMNSRDPLKRASKIVLEASLEDAHQAARFLLEVQDYLDRKNVLESLFVDPLKPAVAPGVTWECLRGIRVHNEMHPQINAKVSGLLRVNHFDGWQWYFQVGGETRDELTRILLNELKEDRYEDPVDALYSTVGELLANQATVGSITRSTFTATWDMY